MTLIRRAHLPLIVSSLLASLVVGCASSYCGAPCDPPPAVPAAVKRPSVVNQYGSVFGYLEVDTMTRSQLQAERTSLELLLQEDAGDGEILRVLKDRDDSAFDFAYNDYSTGGSRFNAKGKLRRDAAVKNPERKIPRMISDSQNRELFERYRRVRLQIPLLERRLAMAPPPKPDTVRPPPPPDTLWAGAFRIDRDSLVAAPGEFPTVEQCRDWGEAKAETFRHQAFAFQYLCRRGSDSLDRKVW